MINGKRTFCKSVTGTRKGWTWKTQSKTEVDWQAAGMAKWSGRDVFSRPQFPSFKLDASCGEIELPLERSNTQIFVYLYLYYTCHKYLAGHTIGVKEPANVHKCWKQYNKTQNENKDILLWTQTVMWDVALKKKQANGEKVAMEKNRCNDWKNWRNINVNRRAVRKVESAVLQHFFLTDTGWLTTENEYVGNTKRRLRLETLSDKQVAGTYHETKKPTTVGKNNAECN